MFSRLFAVLLGLVCSVYGWLILYVGMDGIGLCRLNCGLKEAIRQGIGQMAYNRVAGATFVALGLGFLIGSFFPNRAKKSRSKR